MESSNFDRIERYLTGKMNAEEKNRFIEDLHKDTELKDMYHVVKAEHEAMELLVADKLRKDFQSWKRTPPANPFGNDTVNNQTDTIKLKKGGLMVGILLVILALLYFLSVEKEDLKKDPANHSPNTEKPGESNKEESLEKGDENEQNSSNPESQEKSSEPLLYAYAEVSQKYYERPSSLFGSLRSEEGDAKKQNFDLALSKFSQNDLKGALRIIEKEDEKESKVIFMKACLFFEMKKYMQAAVQFEKIADDELSPFYEETNWYLMLSYLAGLPSDKSKFDAVSKKILNDPDNYYYEKTKLLTREVK